eukprot:TRINITY_DN2815_c0_g2_i1.p7 TRINITY_DN2815_c0_g2~~TRINITY_DN2815_c0_g2_i1.p7  ORF type:complete len:107 (+),score=2.64 TRINITY_DN2815_c0_g2_i1:438-758(+)
MFQQRTPVATDRNKVGVIWFSISKVMVSQTRKMWGGRMTQLRFSSNFLPTIQKRPQKNYRGVENMTLHYQVNFCQKIPWELGENPQKVPMSVNCVTLSWNKSQVFQ